MRVDDIVVFNRGHYNVLAGYAVIREVADRRLENIGRVVQVGDGWVSVLWLRSNKISCHFPDNLQVLRRAA